MLGIFSLIRFEPDYCLIVGVCLTLSIANIVGFTKCRKGEQGDFFFGFQSLYHLLKFVFSAVHEVGYCSYPCISYGGK